jgi:hypothetical protein
LRLQLIHLRLYEIINVNIEWEHSGLYRDIEEQPILQETVNSQCALARPNGQMVFHHNQCVILSRSEGITIQRHDFG